MLRSQAEIRVISRNSNLALKQVDEVFSKFPETQYKIIPTQSFGDKNKQISLLTNSIPDFFTRELDLVILNNEADIAIHSAKDLPYPLPEGLEIIALLEAFDKTDSLVCKDNLKLSELKQGSRVGTSSQARKNELLSIRPDLQIVSIRGTIEERIEQVENASIDALIVATCALKRLGLENRIAEVLPFETHPLQGHLAIVAKSGNENMKQLFSEIDIRKNYGTVYLVGFGPGDPELLTIRAEKLISKADVIFYDDLINKEFLNNYKAEKIYVGKRKDSHSKEQNEINKLLFEAAILGKQVVRLKGGDPMIFAHGGEEIEYLQERLVNVEVTPGISTALAAASSLKISLTHRDLSSSVSFISGHSENDVIIPDSGTVVYYMGASNLKNIAIRAIKKGLSLNTPVALIHNVSLPDQKEFYSTLKELSESTTKYPTPLLAIVGDIVGLKHNKAGNIKKPNILFTGTDASFFEGEGNVIHMPLIELGPLKSAEHLKPVLSKLHTFDYIVFTSKHTVKYFFELIIFFKIDIEDVRKQKIISIGKITSQELKKYGIIPSLQPVDESSEGIIELVKKQEIKGAFILIPRSDMALQILPNGLKLLGNHVVTAIIYNNSIPENIVPVDLTNIDSIVFSSPSGVDNFLSIYGSVPQGKTFISKGKVTYKRLVERGFFNTAAV